MTQDSFRYVIELHLDGRSLGMTSVSPDWEPALEGAAFEAMRCGGLALEAGAAERRIEPIWDGSEGPPRVSAFRAVVDEFAREIPIQYLGTLAQDASKALVESGEIEAGQLFRYRVLAFPAERETREHDADGFHIEEEPRSISCAEARLSLFLAASETDGEGVEVAGDFPTFVPRSLLEEATNEASQANGVETGGILIGFMHRDSGAGELFLEVTAQIPVQHAVADSTKLTFTPETWAAARGAIALRGRGEMMVGWWHLHPDWCRSCPPENRRRCALGKAFFSAEDVHLHRVCFSRAYHVALLLSENVDSGYSWSAFGWRRGLVESRGIQVLGERQTDDRDGKEEYDATPSFE